MELCARRPAAQRDLRQIALAMRDEVLDLEEAGIAVIQIDEPALREGLPLRARGLAALSRLGRDAFRLASRGVRDDTQIHTHMCYSEFNDIIDCDRGAGCRCDLDRDVALEHGAAGRVREFNYPNEIGPGVYDIHSPRVPEEEEMVELLEKARRVSPAAIWVNPDCGLKTRGWAEVVPAPGRNGASGAATSWYQSRRPRDRRPGAMFTRMTPDSSAFRCPCCGGDNAWRVAASTDADHPCWCRTTPFLPALLARTIVRHSDGTACILVRVVSPRMATMAGQPSGPL